MIFRITWFHNPDSMKSNCKYSEKDLVTFIKQNDKEAFSYLYEHYAGSLMYVVGKYVDDPYSLEDLLQDIFVKIWTKIDQYDPEKSSLYTWMRTVAKNRALDFLKCSANVMNAKTTNDPTLERRHIAEQKTDKIGLNQLVSKLPEQHRSIVYLVYYNGHTLDETSKYLNIPMGTIKTRLRNALAILRKDFAFSV